MWRVYNIVWTLEDSNILHRNYVYTCMSSIHICCGTPCIHIFFFLIDNITPDEKYEFLPLQFVQLQLWNRVIDKYIYWYIYIYILRTRRKFNWLVAQHPPAAITSAFTRRRNSQSPRRRGGACLTIILITSFRYKITISSLDGESSSVVRRRRQ